MIPAALAQARATQATADRESAERTLARVMRRLDRTFDPVVFPVAEAITWRQWEGLLELRHPPAAFARAYSDYRRAQRLEMRARSAAHRARFEIRPPSGASGAPVALSAEAVIAGLRELRAA